MNDRLLRVAAVLSVLALMGMAGAGAAAAQSADFNVTVEDAPIVSPFGEDIDITINTTNVGNASGSAEVTFAADAASGNIGPGATVTGPSYPITSLGAGDSDVRTITLNTDTDYQPLTNNDTSETIFHGAFVNNTATGTVNDTDEAPLTVGTDSNGRVTIRTQDDTGQPVETDVDLYRSDTFNGVNDPGPLLREGQSQLVSPGSGTSKILFDGLAVGENDTLSEDYTAVAALDDPEFSSGTTQLELFETSQTEDDGDITVDRNTLPERFEIIQSSESALADGEDSILFNVSIIGDLNGERLTDEDFTVFHDGGSAVSPANGTTFNTGSNGFVEFEATSNVSQRVNFRFVVDRRDREGNKVVEIREKTFVIEGEGTVIGDVWDASFAPGPTPEHSLPDAKVWTFQKSQFSSQSIRVPPAENSTDGETDEDAFDTNGQDSFFRLIRSEDASTTTPSDDEILDVTQDYRIDNDGQNENLSISRVRELDQNDSTVGSGWAVRANTDNPCSSNVTGTCLGTGMYVTPLESDPEAYYYVQKSDNLLNASDQRFVDQSAPDDPFFNIGSGFEYEVGGTSQYAANRNVTPNQPTQDFVRRTGNLTFEAAQEFSAFSGQQLWDITDENGEYILDDLFTDFQAGVDYTIIANKPGYEIEFVDGLVTESGAFFEDGTDENFGLRRIEQDTDVNITNIARLNDADVAPGGPADDPDSYDDSVSGITEFSNKTDQFSQVVPRDGETVDVILLETFLEDSQTPASETVELRIPDKRNGDNADRFNFTGEFIATAGAESASLNGDTATVTTGSDGQAIVWLQSDLSIDSLDAVKTFGIDNDGLVCERVPQEPGSSFTSPAFEGIIAQSTTDAGSIDTSCKDFRGVNVFESGSISGTVRNNDQGLPETVVWTREFIDTQGNLYTLTPVNGTSGLASAGGSGGDGAVRDETFNFSYYQRTGMVVPDPDTTAPTTTAQFNASELTDFSAQKFGPIATPPGFNETFNFLRFPSDDPENLGDYSMDRVPAQDALPPTFTGDSGVDYRRIQAVQYESGETGNGTSSNPVRIGFTEEGDVVIPVAPRGVIVAPDFQLENLNPADATVTEGDDPIDISATVNNTGLLDGTQDLELTVENSSGVVYSDTISGVSVAAGDTQTETFTDVPAGDLDPGEYNHIVSSDDDTIEGNLTVEEEAEAFFEVSNVEAPDTEKPENVTITADVENTGDGEGTQDISFLMEGEGSTVGGGALDIVFTFDTTGSMGEEIDSAQDSITAFTDEIDASGADARYSLVEFKNGDSSVTLQQDLTSDASAVKSAIDDLSAGGGSVIPEASYGAIRSAVQDTNRRSSARLVVIHITDARAHYDGDGSGATDLTRSDAASDLNGANARFVCACPAEEDFFTSPDPEGNITDMAINDVDDSLFVRLASGDFGDTLTDEIATAVTEAAGGVELNLNAGESDTVSFEVNTEDLAEGEYDVTVNSEDDSGSTTTNITSSTFESPVDGVSDDLWTAVTSQDDTEDDLSLSDVGDAINAYQDDPGDAEIDGVPISLGELGDLISYYQDVVAA